MSASIDWYRSLKCCVENNFEGEFGLSGIMCHVRLSKNSLDDGEGRVGGGTTVGIRVF